MPDNKPTLTTSLLGERDSLLDERNELIRRMHELSSMLDVNASQIEATDTLLFRFDPNHAPAVFERNLLSSTRILETQSTLALPSAKASTDTTATGISEQEPITDTSVPAASRLRPKAKKTTQIDSGTSKATNAPTHEDVSTEQSDSATRKRERSLEEQSISDYFKTSKRNETILQILRAMTEPVNAKTVASHYRSLFPLGLDTKQMRALHTSRVAAALAYLKTTGKVVRIALPKENGRSGPSVVWSLSKSYRSDLKKGQTAGRPAKMNGQASLGAKSSSDSIHISGTTH